MSEFKFYKKVFHTHIKNNSELRRSFILSIVGMILNNSAFIILWLGLIDQVGVINGWEGKDIVGMLGFSTVSFGLVFLFGSALRTIPRYAHDGTFDQFLLSPKNLILRTMSSKFDTSTIGDVIFGVLCISYFCILSHFSILQILLAIVLIIIVSFVFFSVVLCINSLGFFFTDGTSVTQALSELLLTPSLFHGGAFRGGLRFFFTFIVPSLAASVFPVEIIKYHSFSQFLILIGIGVVFFVIGIKLFYFGIKKYESANFMTFGQ